MSEVDFNDLKVVSDPENYGATEVCAYSAKISHDKEGRSALEIASEELGYSGEVNRPEGYEETVKENTGKFLEKLAEMGHTSCFYQANRGVNLEVPRHTTMFLCQFDHPKYLQQSQRYTKAEEFISGMDDSRVRSLYKDSKKLYNEMVSGEGDKIRKEDARYVLPLGTSAVHIHSNLNLVSLANIYRVLEDDVSRVPGLTERAVEEVLGKLSEDDPVLFQKKMVDKLNEEGSGYPVTNMFSETNKGIEELESDGAQVSYFSKEVDMEEGYRDSFMNLSNYVPGKTRVEGFITSMSLSAWHQFMRNDTVKQSVQSVYDSAERGEIVVPPSIKGSEYEKEFENLCRDSLELYSDLKKEFGDDAVEVVPHALSIDVAFSLDFYNRGKGFIKDRIHPAAQWEIREIAEKVDEMLEG